MGDNVATPKEQGNINPVLNRALLTAHLLTGSLQAAEQAVLEGIESWNPDEHEEVLFQKVMTAAAQAAIRKNAADPIDSESYLPGQMKAVARLAPWQRYCFVLRSLAGLPSQVCAGLLRLQSDQVDEYTIDAARCLAAS
jgi:hypothetical protein